MDLFLSSSKSIETMQENFDFPPKVLYENRYCNQDDISILVCGGTIVNNRQIINSVYKLDGRELKCEKFTSMPKELHNFKTAVISSDLYVVGRFSPAGYYDSYVRKFCNKTKTWSCKTKLTLNQRCLCVCFFEKQLICNLSKLYILCL